MSSDLQDYRRRRLVELRDGPFEGNATALGEFLGYKDGAFVRQMISGHRDISEKTVAKITSRHEYRNWLSGQPNIGSQAATGSSPFATRPTPESWPFSPDLLQQVLALDEAGRQQAEGALRLVLAQLQADTNLGGKKVA